MRGTSATMIVPSHDHARAVQDLDLPMHEPNTCVRLTKTLTDETETKLKSNETETEREGILMKLKLKLKQSDGEQLE